MLNDELSIVLMYPELFGTYGDRGNATALEWRAQARGLRTRLIEVGIDDPLPASADIYLLGGSEDSAQLLVARTMRAKPEIARILTEAPVFLAVCAGFQVICRAFARSDGGMEPGVGLIDAECRRIPGTRPVGEVVTESVAFPELPLLSGFENHQGGASLGDAARPFGKIVSGVGNGEHGLEGAVQGNIVATYLHGPVLVRNPALADLFLSRVAGPQTALDDDLVERLRAERIAASAPAARRRRWWRRSA